MRGHADSLPAADRGPPGLDRPPPTRRVPVGEQLAVVDGNLGQPRPPAWMHDLLEHPGAPIEVGRWSVDVMHARCAGPDRLTGDATCRPL